MSILKRIFAAVLMAGAVSAMPARAADVTIGALFPMSGLNASYGDIFSSGANLARE